MKKEGSINKTEIKSESRNANILNGLDWQKIASQNRGQVIRQLNEVAQYCKEQRKSKRPANTLKNSWARTEISTLSAMLAGLKTIELEVLKAKVKVLENAIRTNTK